MAAQTLEQKKQIYSRQLAAHTFRQWNAVCQNQPHEKKKAEDDPRSRGHDIGLTHDDRQSKFGSDQLQTRTPEEQSRGGGHYNRAAVQVVDYGFASGRHRTAPKEKFT